MHWTVIEKIATLTWSDWRWSFDLARPQSGLTVHAMGPTPWQLLTIHPVPQHRCEIEDSFVRGSDLMVRYGQSPSDRFAFQVDLRAVPPAGLFPFLCGWDVWLSVQTQLLDSHPMLEVSSEVPAGRWSATDSEGRVADRDTLAMLTCRSPDCFVVLFVHPSDQCQAELCGESSIRLFGNFMEKGVIRRGRLRCLVSPQALEQSSLLQAYADFAASPLPLTT